jgi:serine/threonine protein kinase
MHCWVSFGFICLLTSGFDQVEQLHKVFKLCGTPSEDYWEKMKLAHPLFKPYERCLAEKFKDVPPSTLSLLETLLSIDPDMRGTATDALNSEVNITSSPSSRLKLTVASKKIQKTKGKTR